MDSPNGNSEADSALEHTQYQLAECKRQLMLKDDELHLQLQEVQKLRSILSGSKSLFSKNKTVFALTQQLDTLQEKEAQLEPLKAEIRRLQESNEKLQSKLACQQEWADRDDYIGGLQQEIQFLKHAVDQAKYDKEQLSEELARVTEEMVARSMHDMEEMNRLNDQVVKLSDFKRVAEEAEATLSDANRQVQKLEEEVAWLMLSSRRRCQSPGGSTSPGGDDAQVVNADFPGGALLHGAEPDTVLDKWRAERQALEEAVRAREQEVRDLDAAARAREQQLTDLEGAVRACEAEVRAQAAELEQLRELRDTNAARIKELEAGKKTAKRDIKMLKECIKELHSTHTTLNQVSTNMEADLESAQGLSERRGKELAALQQVVEADARDWIKETIVGHCIVGACERRVLNGERATLESQLRKAQHAAREQSADLHEKGQYISSLEVQIQALTESLGSSPRDSVSTVGRPGGRDSIASTRSSLAGRLSPQIVASSSAKGLKSLKSKFKLVNKDKEDIAEMRRMVQETLQRSMELEEENNRLKELLEQS
uniref:Uncharacterized protein n=1 Tax=Eutreptiella gymnastica TaxID=73025 RepID=A0A7S4FY78_9EUGL